MCIRPIKIGDVTYYVNEEEWKKLQEWKRRREKTFPKSKKI